MNALADRIRAERSRRPAAGAVADAVSACTNADLGQRASELLEQVCRISANPSPMVSVTLPLSVEAVVWLEAAIVGNLSICFLDPASPSPRREAVLGALRPDVVVDESGVRVSDGDDSRAVEVEAPGYVAMSSGSVGNGPKGVLSSWSSIAAFAAAGAEALELDHESVWAETTHLSFDMAMTNLLLALSSGSAVRVSSALGDRLRPLRFAQRVGATHLRVAPRFIDLALAERQSSVPDTLRVWASGGDRLLVSQAEGLLELGAPAVVNTYGTSETIGFASSARFTQQAGVPGHRGTASVGTGRVGPWTAELVGDSEASVLTIRSAHLPSGYLFGDADGEYPRWECGGVVTGDVGVRVEDHLFCLGRAGRRVKRKGVFIELDAIDARTRSTVGLTTFTLVTSDGELVTLVESRSADSRELQRSVAAHLASEEQPDRVVLVQQLPRLENGKIDQKGARLRAEQT